MFLKNEKASDNQSFFQWVRCQTPGKKEIIKKRNIANSGAIVFEAKEDEIVIFPSKTSHQTQPNVKNNDRISLSADIFIAAKNSENMEHLVTPFKNWKTL